MKMNKYLRIFYQQQNRHFIEKAYVNNSLTFHSLFSLVVVPELSLFEVWRGAGDWEERYEGRRGE